MEEGHFAEACQLLADYRLGKGAGRKQLHCDVRKRCKGWLRFQEESREDGKDHQEPMCHVCRRTGHRGVACRLIALYQKHRAAPGKLMTWEEKIQCHQGMRFKESILIARDEGGHGDVVRCFICQKKGHLTKDCGALEIRFEGGAWRGSNGSLVEQRCATWLERTSQNAKRLMADAAAGCVFCRDGGHITGECKVFERYKADGDNATGMTAAQKRVCKVWIRNHKSAKSAQVRNGYRQESKTPASTKAGASSRYNIWSGGEPLSRPHGPGSGTSRVANGTPKAVNGAPRDTTTTPRIANGIPNGPNSFPAQLPAKPPVSSSRVKSARQAANGNPCIPNTTQSRLPTKQPAPSPQVITPTAPGLYDRCYICESPTHGTDACGSLGVYKKRGGKALGSLPKAYVELCMVWLAGSPNPPEALNAPNYSNPSQRPQFT